MTTAVVPWCYDFNLKTDPDLVGKVVMGALWACHPRRGFTDTVGIGGPGYSWRRIIPEVRAALDDEGLEHAHVWPGIKMENMGDGTPGGRLLDNPYSREGWQAVGNELKAQLQCTRGTTVALTGETWFQDKWRRADDFDYERFFDLWNEVIPAEWTVIPYGINVLPPNWPDHQRTVRFVTEMCARVRCKLLIMGLGAQYRFRRRDANLAEQRNITLYIIRPYPDRIRPFHSVICRTREEARNGRIEGLRVPAERPKRFVRELLDADAPYGDLCGFYTGQSAWMDTIEEVARRFHRERQSVKALKGTM